MAGELERLLVRIEADTTMLRRELANADKAVAGFSGGMDRQLKKSQATFDNFATKIGSSLLRFGALFGTAQLGFKAFDALVKASDINDLARNTALTTESFQAYSFAVERAGGSQEDFSRGMVKLAKQMAELRAGTGGLNEFLSTSLPDIRDQLAATKTQEQAIDVLANAMRRLGDEESRSALAIRAFGKGGENLVEVFQKGSTELARFKAEAQGMGLIISQDQLDNFERLGDDIRKAGIALETYFVKGAGGAWTFWKDLNEEIIRFVALNPTTLSAIASIHDALGATPKAGSLSMFGAGAAAAGKAAAAAAQKAADETPLTFKTKVDNSGRDALAGLHTQMLGAVPGRDREAAYAQMDQELQKFRDMLNEKKISSAEFEQARADLNAIAGAKISASIAQENQKYRDQFREIEGLISGAFDDVLTQSIKNGNVEWKTLAKDMLADLAKLTVKALILAPLMNSIGGGGGGMAAGGMGGGGGLLGMLPMLFGGMRADGGPVSSGKSYLVGENGPEIFSPGSSGSIIPNGGMSGPELSQGRGGASAGGSNVYNFHTTVNAQGAGLGVMQQMQAVMDQRDRAQQRQFEASQREQNRFPSRGGSMATAPPATMRRLR